MQTHKIPYFIGS